MDKARGWRPILPEPLVDQVLDLAEEIARGLENFPPPQRWPTDRASLTTGLPGRALFLGYLERCRPGRGWGDRAVELLEQAMDDLAALPVDLGLYSGFLGLAWVLEHFHGWLVDEGDDPVEDIVEVVVRALVPSNGYRDYDLLSGLTGVGVYALERLPRPGAEECLRQVISQLANLAERREGTAVWKTPAARVPPDRRDLFLQGYSMTGVAHGAAGMISFLAQAHAAGVVEARPLLDEAVSGLLAWKLPPGSGAVFPYEVAPDVAYRRPTRLAWCHGDPGIAAALLGAARRVGESSWEREAMSLALSAAARSTAETTIIDAGLCHGSAGLLHIFNRLFQATGAPALAEAARFWFDRTLELRQPGAGVAGFLAWKEDQDMRQGWQADTGFLSGASGVGLALLAAAAPLEPAWDRLLLVSIPP